MNLKMSTFRFIFSFDFEGKPKSIVFRVFCIPINWIYDIKMFNRNLKQKYYGMDM